MFSILRTAAALFLGLFTAPLAAQDLIGFDRSNFGRAVLSDSQFAGVDLELSVGAYNNESIRNYAQNSIFATLGRAVGRLDILTDKGVFPCTAFLVSEKYVLTNYHCVPGVLNSEAIGASRIEAVQFVVGYTQQGVSEGTEIFTVSPTPVEANESLDYAVLEVFGNPAERYGILQLSDRLPQPGDPYWIIGHPNGEAQRISREQCRANTPAISGVQLLHTCDTLPGNSGSPVIDASLQMVAALHHAGSRRDAVNFAIPMALILEQSQILKVSTKRPSPERTATPNDGGAICDALYTEARSNGDCLAYNAYVTRCADHPLHSIGALYVERECAAAPSIVSTTPNSATKPRPTATPSAPTASVAPSAKPKPTVITVWSGFEVHAPLSFDGLNTPSAVMFSPKGRVLMTSEADGRTQVWSRTLGRNVGATQSSDTALTALALSAKAGVFAVGDLAGSVLIYEARSGKRLQVFEESGGATSHLAFANEGKLVLALKEKGQIIIWNAENGKVVSRIGIEGGAIGFGVAPSGRDIYVLSADGVIHKHSLALGSSAWSHSFVHSGAAALAVSEETGQLAFVDRTGHVSVWQDDTVVATNTYPLPQGSFPSSLVFSPNGKTLGLVLKNAPPAIFDTASGQYLFELDIPASHLAFHPAHPVLAAVTEDGGTLAVYGTQAP